MCVLPELPVLTEETLNSLTIQGAVETTLTAAHNESTSTDETDGEDGEETSSVTWDVRRDGRHRQREAPVFAGRAEHLVFTKCAGLQALRRGRGAVRLRLAHAVLTASYVTDSGTEGTLTLTLGTKTWTETATMPGWMTTPPFISSPPAPFPRW